MQQSTQEPKVFSVTMNQFMTPSGIDMNVLKEHLTASKFFVDEMDARCVGTLLIPSIPLLSQLTESYTVIVDIWAKKEVGHPGWEFRCVERKTGDQYGRSFGQPDMGMGGCGSPNRGFMFGRDAFGRPLGTNQHVTNLELVHVLGAYALTQIHPLPPAKFRAYPAGLELLDLVRERLNGPQYTKDHMGAWQLNPEFHKPVYPGNYANERYNSFAPTNTTRTVRLPSVAFEIELFELASDTAAGIKKQLLDSEVLVKSCDEIELLTMVTEIACQLQMATFEPPADNKLYLTIGELDALPTVLRLSVQAGFNGWIVHSNIPAPHGTVQRAPSIVIHRRQHW